MHKGVHDLLHWLGEHPRFPGVWMNPAAREDELRYTERLIGSPLPTDYRRLLLRSNGGLLPGGQLLSVGNQLWPNVGVVLEELSKHFKRPTSDIELLLPFYKTEDGGVLAFDRSAGPVADTWPVVDYYVATRDLRLVYRTFDGWCRHCVSDWGAPDYSEPFNLHKYLRQGERHAAIEPDVGTAHATVAHALRRAGQPESALDSYLQAARCVPALHWCDWEALKLAALMGKEDEAREAASRLASRAPYRRWYERETTPGRVADVIGHVAARSGDRDAWLRLFDQLAEQAFDNTDHTQVLAVRKAVFSLTPLPETRAVRTSEPPEHGDMEQWWQDLHERYRSGELRDEDLLLDPQLASLRVRYDFAELLKIRREF